MLTRSEFLKFCGLAFLLPRTVRAQSSGPVHTLANNDSKHPEPKADDGVGWQSAPALPIPVQEIYAATVKNQLYVAGGIAARLGIPYFTDRCFKFDGATSQWQEIAKYHCRCITSVWFVVETDCLRLAASTEAIPMFGVCWTAFLSLKRSNEIRRLIANPAQKGWLLP